MPGGRPTKYNEEILIRTEEYIDSCEDLWTEVVIPTSETLKDGSLAKPTYKQTHKVNIPTIEGLAYYIKVNKDTINEWRKEHGEFSVLIGELLAKQVNALISKGLSGDYNPTIAKVLLSKYGYREGIDTDLTSGGEKLDMGTKAAQLAKEYEEKLKKDL